MPHLTLHHFFDWRWFSFSTFTGWMVVIAHTFNALAGAVYLMVVVRIDCCGLVALLMAVHQKQACRPARQLGRTSRPSMSLAQVERAKKCLDFAVTLYFVHSIICVSVSGFSRSFAWCGVCWQSMMCISDKSAAHARALRTQLGALLDS